MHPIRKRKLWVVLFIFFALSLALGLVLYALRQNISLYYTPTQVAQGLSPTHHEFRLGGMVEKGSVHHDADSFKVTFVLTDFHSKVPVTYTGVLPDLFREGQGIVASGQFMQGQFIAREVLAKHDEKYMPVVPEKVSGSR